MCSEERQLCAIECCWNIKIPLSVKVPFFSERLPSQDCFLRPGFSINFPLYPLFSNRLRAEQWIFSQLPIEFCYFFFFTAYWNVCFWYLFWKKSIFYFQFCVYVYVYEHLWVQVSMEAREGARCLPAGVTGTWESPDTGDKNQTQVLCVSGGWVLRTVESSLHPQYPFQKDEYAKLLPVLPQNCC